MLFARLAWVWLVNGVISVRRHTAHKKMSVRFLVIQIPMLKGSKYRIRELILTPWKRLPAWPSNAAQRCLQEPRRAPYRITFLWNDLDPEERKVILDGMFRTWRFFVARQQKNRLWMYESLWFIIWELIANINYQTYIIRIYIYTQYIYIYIN